MKTKTIISALCSLLGVALAAAVIVWAVNYESVPNDGISGEYRVYGVIYQHEPDDEGKWTVEVEEYPYRAKSKPFEITVDTATRDYLATGDLLTLQEGVVTDVVYMEHTDVPGGDRREKIMKPYSTWTEEQIERKRLGGAYDVVN